MRVTERIRPGLPFGAGYLRKTLAAGVVSAAALSIMPAVASAATPLKHDRGGLRVVAEGVPQGRSAAITVAGRKFRKKLPKAGMLRNLRPGKYRVWATPIVTGGGTAAVPNLPVRIRVPKRSSPTLRLQYQWNPKNDVYPPGPVTGLKVNGRSTSTVSLSWTNSQAPDLQGVAIRRKIGNAPPTRIDEGRVVEVGRSAESVVDDDLRQYTTYSYSVFMVDTAGNASAAASVTVQTLGRASMLAAGTQHTCALLPDDERNTVGAASGRVACWGRNDHGQLGVGDRRDSDRPLVVDLDNVVQISAGGDHTCARQRDGQVWCWGRNDHGQIGDGSTDDATSPVAPDLPASDWIAAGGRHSCSVSQFGGLRCWGADGEGQTGQGTGTDVITPPAQSIVSNVTSVATGWAHTCAIRAGALRCFGDNAKGQLGGGSGLDGTDTDTSSVVSGLPGDVVSVAAGVEHTCALIQDARLSCWGGNDYGQVGNGGTDAQTAPVTVLDNVAAVSAGAYHTCAALDNATMRCWGRNHGGRLGDGTEVDHANPARVAIASGVSALAAGGYHSCAVSGPDTYCWGANPFGQLGTVDLSGSLRPSLVQGLWHNR